MPVLSRVLFTESSPNIGGQELQLLQQAQGLQQRDIAVSLACRPGSRIATVAAEQGITTHLLPFRNSFHLPTLLQLRKLLATLQPDVVISHSGHDANAAAVAARLLMRRPKLLRSRTYQPGVPKAWTYNTLVDLTLVPSLYLKSRLLQNPAIRPDKIAILYPAITFLAPGSSPSPSLPEKLRAHIAGTRQRLMVHAAMLRGEKGHAVILDVLPRLLQQFPDLCYVIAGEGELHEALAHRVAAEGLQSNVLFLGMIDYLPALLVHTELLVMPSLYEPLGMSQIEALSQGVPVVASRTGGIPETVDDVRTGLLAEPGDREDWLAKLAWALDNREQMRAMAACGSTEVRARFSASHNIDELERQLVALLG